MQNMKAQIWMLAMQEDAQKENNGWHEDEQWCNIT